MTYFTDYLQNKVVDWYKRGQTFTPPTNHFFGLLTTTKGPRANSTVYALNDTISLTANDAITHMYKCTTAGTSAAAQSTLYPGARAEAITDGTAVFTEQSVVMDAAGATAVEVTGGAYARQSVACSLANFAGTQGAGTTVASTGVNGLTSNNASITFSPAPTANWGFVWAVGVWDASTVGNMLEWDPLTTVKTVNNGDPAPSIAAAGYQVQLGL